MQSYDFDPIIGTDIIHVLGIDPNTLSNARVYSQVKNIIDFYKSNPNARNEILKVINNKQGNPLEIMWTFVELQKSKQEVLSKFDLADFEPDIAQELSDGYLTIKKKEAIRNGIKERKERIAREQIEKDQNKLEVKLEKSLAPLDTRLDIYEDALSKLEAVDQELSYY